MPISVGASQPARKKRAQASLCCVILFSSSHMLSAAAEQRKENRDYSALTSRRGKLSSSEGHTLQS
jgi:hypothetical protein